MSTPAPDALHDRLPGSDLRPFAPADLAELVVLQRCCWVPQAIVNDTLDVPALHETPDEVLAWTSTWTTLVLRLGPRLVGAVRGRAEDRPAAADLPAGRDWQAGRLMVAPDLAGRGVGAGLLAAIESCAPEDVDRLVLFTGGRSERNLRFYRRAGYEVVPGAVVPPGHIAGAVLLARPRR